MLGQICDCRLFILAKRTFRNINPGLRGGVHMNQKHFRSVADTVLQVHGQNHCVVSRFSRVVYGGVTVHYGVNRSVCHAPFMHNPTRITMVYLWCVGPFVRHFAQGMHLRPRHFGAFRLKLGIHHRLDVAHGCIQNRPERFFRIQC